MTVALLGDGTLELSGHCPIEDAEDLHRHILTTPNVVIHWPNCEHAHTAVVQVLLASQKAPVGPPKGKFLQQRVAPLLAKNLA